MTSKPEGVRTKGPTIGHLRRSDPNPAVKRSWFEPTAVKPAPPAAPAMPPRPLGDLSAAPIEQITELAKHAFGYLDQPNQVRVAGDVRRTLDRLSAFDGETWQQRWEAAGCKGSATPLLDAIGDHQVLRSRVNAGIGRLFAMRVIQPSLEAFRAYNFGKYAQWFTLIANEPLLQEFTDRIDRSPMSPERRRRALFDVTAALTIFGIDLADLTPEALLHYSMESRRLGLVFHGSGTLGAFAGGSAWPVLHEMGVFPAATPKSLRAAVVKGQRTVEELIDRYRLRNQGVRQLLIDYIQRRTAELDYATADALTRTLALTFWQTIEAINPDQADLRLDEATVTEWKRRLATRADGKPRIDIDGPMHTVRALYLDLQSWAVAEPELWSQWSAPCPVRDTDLRWAQVRRRRHKEKMDGRTRERQPILPPLVDHVTASWRWHHDLMEAAAGRGRGEQFECHGRTWKRLINPSRRNREWHESPNAPVRVQDCETGEIVPLTAREHQAFWRWAIIETLRHSALRGTRRAHPPQRPPVPAPERRSRSAAGGQPVQD